MKSEELRRFVRKWAKLGLVCLAFCTAVVGFAAESISITATPRYPWNGKVDLKFTIDGTSGTKYDISFTAKDVAGGTNLTMKTLTKSDGTAANVAKEQLLPGTYNWVWDATADLTSRWPSHAGCVPTSSTVLFKDTQLAAIEDFYAVLCGAAIKGGKTNPEKGKWIKADGTGKSVQFTYSADDYTKCVCVHFEQSGVDVVGYVKWARYVDGSGHDREDFDANSATTMTIATSETASGYGACELKARVTQPDVSVVLDRVVVEAVSKDTLGGVQLWENGPYWAECNVGATKPEEYGYYFWWGDTVGYRANTNSATWKGSVWHGVKWVSSAGVQMSSCPFISSACPTLGKGNSTLQSLGYIDLVGNLVPAHDAATAHLGAPWRMPTDDELSALESNCDTEWTTQGGVSGRLVKGRGAYSSKSIFLPAAGNGVYDNDSYLYAISLHGAYLSSTPDPGTYYEVNYDAWYLYFDSGHFFRNQVSRYVGASVRPVRGFVK